MGLVVRLAYEQNKCTQHQATLSVGRCTQTKKGHTLLSVCHTHQILSATENIGFRRLQVTCQKSLSVISQHCQPEKHSLGSIMRMKEIVSDNRFNDA